MILHSARWETKTRWYEAWITIDLFGDVVLIRHWGGKDNKHHGQKTTLCTDLAEAFKMLEVLRKQRQSRPDPYVQQV